MYEIPFLSCLVMTCRRPTSHIATCRPATHRLTHMFPKPRALIFATSSHLTIGGPQPADLHRMELQQILPTSFGLSASASSSQAAPHDSLPLSNRLRPTTDTGLGCKKGLAVAARAYCFPVLYVALNQTTLTAAASLEVRVV